MKIKLFSSIISLLVTLSLLLPLSGCSTKHQQGLINSPVTESKWQEEATAVSDNDVTATASITDQEKAETDAFTTEEAKAVNISDTSVSVSADTYFIYDIKNERYLLSVNTDRMIVPASITKLLTALYALDTMPSNTVIKPQDELSLVKKGSSIAYITKDHKLFLEMLVEAMLLPSGNDAAYVVAAAVGRYTSKDYSLDKNAAVSAFMDGLNDYAVSIGCKSTHFTVPDGFAYEDHYTTAEDLITIARKAVENNIIMKYTALPTDKVTYASGHTNTWKNSNLLVNPESEYYRPCVTGLKTGSLDTYSLLVSARVNDNDYIIGVFDSPSSKERYRDAVMLVDALLSVL